MRIGQKRYLAANNTLLMRICFDFVNMYDIWLVCFAELSENEILCSRYFAQPHPIIVNYIFRENQ